MSSNGATRTDDGIDNPALTTDSGSNEQPPNLGMVISVQPQSGGTRAPLPVTTVDWQTNSRGQFIPRNGLDFLLGVTKLLIQQTIELNDLTSRIESENRYILRVPNGEALYIASEVSNRTERCLCGTGRSFVMHLHDNTRQEALMLKRRLAAASCCFPCRLQEMTVITPPGDYIGRVQQRWTWMVPFYLVRGVDDEVLYVLEGPAVMRKSALMLTDFKNSPLPIPMDLSILGQDLNPKCYIEDFMSTAFHMLGILNKILTGDALREVGKISHGWDRDLNSFATTLLYPDNAAQPKHKALLLAAAFLLEYTYFERAKSSFCRCNCL